MQIVKDILRAIFNRTGKRDESRDAAPAGKSVSINEFIDMMKQSFDEDDHVLLTQFVHETVLRRARAGEMQERHKNVIASTLSAGMLSKLTKGEDSYYFPAQAKNDGKGPIVFTYDCYVPVHMLIDEARSVYNWMRMMDGIRQKNGFGGPERREEAERMGAVKAYMDSLNDIREHIAKPAELDARTDLIFFDKDHDRMPFYSSAVEFGGGFDFVMRPNGGMPTRKPRKAITSKPAQLPRP